MDEPSILTRRMDALERRWRWTAALFGILAALVLIIALVGALRNPPDVLRARGLVITDTAGKTRIVLGAPMLDATADARLAQTVGLVVLDSSGRLNVAVGANAPAVSSDGTVVKRIAAEAGLTIYDPRNGGERGGIGAFEDGRAIICLDYETGKEAACMSVAPNDAHAAVMLNGTPNEKVYDRVGMFLGDDGLGLIKVYGGDANPNGLVLEAGTASARLVAYDGVGNEIGEAQWKASLRNP